VTAEATAAGIYPITLDHFRKTEIKNKLESQIDGRK